MLDVPSTKALGSSESENVTKIARVSRQSEVTHQGGGTHELV